MTAIADISLSGVELDDEKIPELESDSKGENLYVVKLGSSYEYTIPSFSVISVKLRHAVIQDASDGEVKLGDVFFKEELTQQMIC